VGGEGRGEAKLEEAGGRRQEGRERGSGEAGGRQEGDRREAGGRQREAGGRREGGAREVGARQEGGRRRKGTYSSHVRHPWQPTDQTFPDPRTSKAEIADLRKYPCPRQIYTKYFDICIFLHQPCLLFWKARSFFAKSEDISPKL
jgi:hypothetical protein